MPIPPAAYRSASDADLTEKIGTVVKAGERIANRAFEHVALKSLVVRIEPHQLENDLGAELDAIAILECERPLWGNLLPFTNVPFELPWSVIWTIPSGPTSDTAVPSRDSDIVDLKVALPRPAESLCRARSREASFPVCFRSRRSCKSTPTHPVHHPGRPD